MHKSNTAHFKNPNTGVIAPVGYHGKRYYTMK